MNPQGNVGGDGRRRLVRWSWQKSEKALVDTIALTPSTGMVIDPYLDTETGGGGRGEAESESFLSGIFQAGPLAVGGLIANGLNVVATVAVARLLTTNQYGGIAQLLGLYFVLSMPGSALLVSVVRRITAMTTFGHGAEAREWTTRLYRKAVVGVAIWSVVSVAVEGPISHALRLPDDGGVACTMIAAGFWLLLSLDRAVLQSHRRYASLGLSLIIEIGVRTVLVLTFAELGWGIWGYAAGLLIGEVVATAQARAAGRRPGATRRRRHCRPISRALADLVDRPGRGPGRLCLPRRAPERRHHFGGPPAPLPRRVLCGHLRGVQGAGLRGHPARKLHPPRSVDPLAPGGHALRQLGVTLVFFLVPTCRLLLIALAVPKQFLTLFFGARLAGGAPAFATLVGAMACLGATVVLTNYLLGAARRWIVAFLGLGMVCLLVLIHAAHGGIMGTARAELAVQGSMAFVVLVAFLIVHLRAHQVRGTSTPR
jgi:O-antigen/teichoic acid export membrane protein